MDNTFACPDVDFPHREEAYNLLVNILKNHEGYRIFIFTYYLGKEEVLLSLAEQFETLIVVDEDRYKKIKLMELSPELFTTDPAKGWIHVKNIKNLKNTE